ncbi:uncharacterized protein FA14DRAFT_7242 [Meira miltonrushii]|uniref:Uncharacterized protein n=1 Tax=Meira miltonrushii TaxID=1280837 RepID=A0A316VGP5_9BASI|nr:uncharacterized protein FA14DRAFT_7242 [Meira miltonrushii]PWN36817.1 hypothetical protein FA14DRAFT_7242 [Meira miltonrushii]
MPSRGKANRFVDDEAGRSSEKRGRGRPKKRQYSNSYDEELEDVSDLGNEDTEEESDQSEQSGEEEESGDSGEENEDDEESELDDDMPSTSRKSRSRRHNDDQSEEESDIQTPKRGSRRTKLREMADSASDDDEDESNSRRSVSLDQSSTSRQEPSRKKVYPRRVRRTKPKDREFSKLKFRNSNLLSKWRPLAKEERILVTQRGGMIWQVAKPLLARMPEYKRGPSAKLLKTLLSSVDAQLSKTPVPPTARMPKVAADNAGNVDSALSQARPMTSSLMSWVAETGGKIQRSDREGTEDDPEKTMVDETLKGFEADIAILESLLVPEAKEVVQLMSSLTEQKKKFAETRTFFDEIKKDAGKIDSEAEAGSRGVYEAVRKSLRKVGRLNHQLPLERAEDFVLRESSREMLR